MFGLLFYSSNHIESTKEYFDNLSLQIIEIKNPDSLDWNKNPFKKPNRTWLGSILRPSLFFTLRDHKIIVVKDVTENEIRIFWRQAESNIFLSGSIHFLESLDLTADELEKYKQKIVVISNKCPACGSDVKDSDKNCPECGLNYQ